MNDKSTLTQVKPQFLTGNDSVVRVRGLSWEYDEDGGGSNHIPAVVFPGQSV